MNISETKNISIESYNYDLPDERIAKYPLGERDASKLLVYRDKEITDTAFKEIANYIPDNSLMVFNNTKVIQARLEFKKDTGARIEVFCLEPYIPNDYLSCFQQTEKCSWLCLIGNAKKWKEGALTQEIDIKGKKVELVAQWVKRIGEANEVLFSWNSNEISFADILEAVGELPIPPYLNRKTEESDTETYQTVYSKIIGSVAAPTAGLHFTPKVLESLKKNGGKTQEVTLHVGAGTFKPVKSKSIGEHDMHAELISVNRETIKSIVEHDGNILAVGTTSVRTLESLYYLGILLSEENNTSSELFVDQWMPYNENGKTELSAKESLNNILKHLDKSKQNVLIARTAIMIAPGYEFKIVDGIVTNFHQPKSTLLLLVSAFVKENNWQTIYNHALENDYRFLSYGDSSLLLKE